MDKISHTSGYVGAIRCGVSTPLQALYYLEWFKTALDNHDQQVLTSVIGKLCINNKYSAPVIRNKGSWACVLYVMYMYTFNRC